MERVVLSEKIDKKFVFEQKADRQKNMFNCPT
jgi:hypothetical protein